MIALTAPKGEAAGSAVAEEMRGQAVLAPIVLAAKSAQGWVGKDAREILRPAVKSAGPQDDKLKRMDGSARLKPRPDTNPYGFHSRLRCHGLKGHHRIVIPSMRDDDVFL